MRTLSQSEKHSVREIPISIRTRGAVLSDDLSLPRNASAIVLFAHGSGSSRNSLRNRFVARELQEHGLATLLMDLLSQDEEIADLMARTFRFDIARLSSRPIEATHWVQQNPETRNLRIGYFGASTGAAVALVAAAECHAEIGAIVSRSGRPNFGENNAS